MNDDAVKRAAEALGLFFGPDEEDWTEEAELVLAASGLVEELSAAREGARILAEYVEGQMDMDLYEHAMRLVGE